jgi:hypothetical protein
MNTLVHPDTDFLASLPDESRTELRRWQRAFESIEPPVTRALARLAREMGVSGPTVKRRWQAFKRGDWLNLFDKRNSPAHWKKRRSSLPGEFVEYWMSIQQEYQRDTTGRAAHDELMRRWRRGVSIPGYAAHPEADPMTGVPAGWDYRNLMRREYRLNVYEAKATRVGRNAATIFLPKVLSTRVGVQCGQIIMFDDQEYDQLVNFIGVNRKLTRPTGFNALDLLSGCDILQGYKPTILHPDGLREKLRQIDFEWFFLNYLTTVGWREDTGTLCIGERGTTKAGKVFMARVEEATKGKVRWDSGGLHNQPAIAGLFEGQPRGNPRFKAARESLFRLCREEMAALPGATGKDREHAPEGNYGLEIANRKLLAEAERMEPEQAQRIRFPVMEWNEFVRVADLKWQQINRRIVHHLEGWKELGFIAHEWRPSLQDAWQPSTSYLTLAAQQRAVVEALISSTPGLCRTRLLSPWEVWNAGRCQLKRLTGAAVPVLLGIEAARPARVTKDCHFIIEDQEIEPDEMWFLAQANGRMLPRLEEFLVYLNPFNPTVLEVCDRKGAWLGSAPRWQRDCRADAEALRRRYGAVRSIEAAELSKVQVRAAPMTEQRIADLRHNKLVRSGAPITPEEKARACQIADRVNRIGAEAESEILQETNHTGIDVPTEKDPADEIL